MAKVKLLETTIRDGSYAIDFSFTSTDVAIICSHLEEAGFEYIEIGHGVGLNASNSGYGKAAQTDEEYMIAAEKSLKTSKYGMFCIPGIARLEDIDLAKEHNMGFIRVGTNITEIEKSEPFIKKAKELGMFVMANYMKSYALGPEDFAERVKLSESYGADVVYLVDSSGGMFAKDIKKYYDAIREVSNIPLGFHGHDNLGMAICNSIECAEIGFDFVDCSLQGLGRSAGNAATEILVAAMLKQGYEIRIDLIKTLNIGHKYVQPLVNTRGKAVLDVVSGYADFHSSFMGYIQKYSNMYSIDPVRLIIEICRINKVNIDEKILDRVARTVQRENIYLGRYNFNQYLGGFQDGK
ncbi:MAG: 4-hydroxy-2-oxovalerate aldolase [Ignavibacteriales bacterium]